MTYVQEKGWNVKEVYVDDGWSGANFDRPDFNRMIQDIEKRKINCVTTKDLSRLGRNYIKTGYYTEEFFPEMGVRYIAINDSIDTAQQNNDIAPFHNILNEWYPKRYGRLKSPAPCRENSWEATRRMDIQNRRRISIS